MAQPYFKLHYPAYAGWSIDLFSENDIAVLIQGIDADQYPGRFTVESRWLTPSTELLVTVDQVPSIYNPSAATFGKTIRDVRISSSGVITWSTAYWGYSDAILYPPRINIFRRMKGV